MYWEFKDMTQLEIVLKNVKDFFDNASNEEIENSMKGIEDDDGTSSFFTFNEYIKFVENNNLI